MIHYRTKDGSSNTIDDSRDTCVITIKDHMFSIERTSYGWDEYDFYVDNIDEVVELRIE